MRLLATLFLSITGAGCQDDPIQSLAWKAEKDAANTTLRKGFVDAAEGMPESRAESMPVEEGTVEGVEGAVVDPLGIRCGQSLGEPLDADWVEDAGVPSGIEVGPTEEVDVIEIELSLFDGREIQLLNSTHEASEDGSLTAPLDHQIDSAFVARIAESGVPFGFVSAEVFGEDSEGKVRRAQTLPRVMLRVDESGPIALTPAEASAAYAGVDNEYPDLVGQNEMAVAPDGTGRPFHIALVANDNGH